MRDYKYYKNALSGIPMPYAFLDLDLLQQNIEDILTRSNGKNIRIASKSIRSTAVLKRILESSNQFQGIMCYAAQEAVDLAKEGFHDLLLGYPIWDPTYLQAIARETQEGAQITLMVDSIKHVKQIETIALNHNMRLPLCIDLDLSYPFFGLHFGVYRSPIRTIESLLELVKYIASSDHVWLDGVMGYEAQIAGVGDNHRQQKLKSLLIRWLKKRSIRELRQRRAEAIKHIHQLGLPLRFVNGGGTGSLLTTSTEQVVTEVTVGSGFFSPTLFDHYRDFRYQPTAGYAIEIVRKPKQHVFTCAGGGYIASGAVGVEKQPTPYLPAGAKLISLEGTGEVQTPILYNGPEELQLGDPIFMRHSKSGELCEHFTHLHCISGGKVVEKITTYRGEEKCYL